MSIIVRFKKPDAGMYEMIVQPNEKLQVSYGKARRIPPNKDKIFNSVPLKLVTSIQEVPTGESK